MKTELSASVDFGLGSKAAVPDTSDKPVLSEQFAALLAAAQRPLYSYIRTLLGPGTDTDDVLQAVNLVLCRKASEFDGRGRFLSWACRVAHLQVLAYLKERRRNKHQYLDAALLEELARPLVDDVEELDLRLDALRNCLGRLSPLHRRMILARYAPGATVQQVAQGVRRSAGSVRVTLHRIRLLLLDCVQKALAGKGSV